MPANDGFGAHDDDGFEHFGEHASDQSEQDAISRTNAGLGHRTTQDDELLAKDDIFGEKRGARTEGRTQRAQDRLENLDEHRGEKATTSGSPEKFRQELRSVRLGTEFLRRTAYPD